MYRTALISLRVAPRARLFSTTPAACKTVTEKVSEVADKVNKGVGSGLADAIDAGEDVAHKAKEVGQQTLGMASESTKQAAEKAGKKVDETNKQAQQKANETMSKARQTKDNM